MTKKEELKSLRKKAGLTSEQASLMYGKSKSYISMIESPSSIMSDKKFEDIKKMYFSYLNKDEKKDNVLDILNILVDQQREFFENEARKNEEFRKTMLESFALLSKLLLNNDTRNIKQAEHKAKQNKPVESYSEFKKRISHKLKNRDANEILSKTYRYMDKNYGICFAQQVKDFEKTHNGKSRSTLEVAHWIDNKTTTEHLFEDCLDTVLNEVV